MGSESLRSARVATPRPGTLGLGIDIGSTNTKVALVDLRDGEIVVLSVHTAATPDDASELVEVTLGLVRQAIAQTDAAPEAVGIASMAETGVPLDSDGTPLSRLVRWNGTREDTAVDPLSQTLGREALFLATGVPPAPKAPLVRWEWLSRNQPDLWHAMARWVGVSELVALALTREFATDHTLAGRTMAYRRPGPGGVLPRGFDPELLGTVGLRPEQLPRVVAPGEPVGGITRRASSRTGLTAGTPVFIAGHDHAVGSWAAGVRDPGDVADSVGTAEALVRVLGHPLEPRAVLASGMSLTRTVTGEHEALLAGAASAGSLVRWWSDTRLGGRDPGDLLADGNAVTIQPSGLIVLPYLRGRQTPAPDPLARVRVLDSRGAERSTDGVDPKRLAQAVLEALALQLRWMDAEQRRLAADASLATLVVLGGPGARSGPALAVKSAVLGTGLRVASVAEPVACGAALLALSRLGVTGPVLPRRFLESATGPGGRYDAVYSTFVTAATRRADAPPIDAASVPAASVPVEGEP